MRVCAHVCACAEPAVGTHRVLTVVLLFGMTAQRVINWTVVVLTCQHKDSVYAFQRGKNEGHLFLKLPLVWSLVKAA